MYRQRVDADINSKYLSTLLAQLSSGLYDTNKAVSSIASAVDEWETKVAPWLRSAKAEAVTNDKLQALWYLNFAKEALDV